jgi:VanZ family protein
MKQILSHCWLLCTTSCLVLITYYSLIPQPADDTLYSWTAYVLPWGDKSLHILAYALLMIPVMIRKPRHWGWIALACVLYGAGIEGIQPSFGRCGEVFDACANAVGVLWSICLFQGVYFLRKYIFFA